MTAPSAQRYSALIAVIYVFAALWLNFSAYQAWNGDYLRSTKMTMLNYERNLGRSEEETFTIVVSVYSPTANFYLNIDHWLSCPNVNEVHVVWHDPKKPVTEILRTMQQEDPRIVVRPQIEDLLTNRFNTPSTGFKTEAVFSADADFVIDCTLLNVAFDQWKNNTDAMVGFEPRLYDWNRKGQGYDWDATCKQCMFNTLFVTKGGFLHRSYFEHFFDDEFKSVRNIVEKHITGEDMLMSFVHYSKNIQKGWKESQVIHIQSIDFEKKYFLNEKRIEFLKENGLTHQSIENLKASTLGSRSSSFRGEITAAIRSLSKNLLRTSKIMPIHSEFFFVGRDLSVTKRSSVCRNAALKKQLVCSTTDSL